MPSSGMYHSRDGETRQINRTGLDKDPRAEPRRLEEGAQEVPIHRIDRGKASRDKPHTHSNQGRDLAKGLCNHCRHLLGLGQGMLCQAHLSLQDRP